MADIADFLWKIDRNAQVAYILEDGAPGKGVIINGSITRFLRVFPTGYKSGPGKPVGASWSYPVVRIR
jgi:hypothetical protein